MDLKYILLIMGLVLLVGTASAALDGYAYSQTIDYTACDQDIYQQDIVIHRSTGTAYEETSGGLNVWHLYVGTDCQEDYDDLRFADATGTELPYYLWPDYDSSSARVCIRLEGATSAGALTVWHGNATATTTSDGDTVYFVFDHFDGDSVDSAKWDAKGNIAVAGGVCTVIGSGFDTSGISSKQSFGTGVIAEIGHNVPPGSGNLAQFIGFAPYLSYNSGVSIYYSGGSSYVWASGNGGAFTTGGTRDAYAISRIVRSPSFTNLYNTAGDLKSRVAQTGDYPITFNNAGTAANYLDYILVRAYSATPPAATAFLTGPAPEIPPTAAFTASPTSGTAPLTVQFTDTTENTPTAWAWTFGDGGTSAQQHPSHTYDEPGTYTVSLTATNAEGSDEETKTWVITVYSAGPRYVATYADLCKVGTGTDGWTLDADYIQTADIQCPAEENFPIIGRDEIFEGSYDGGNHAIRGLSITSSDYSVGMFSSIGGGATLKNIKLDNCNVSGIDNVGGLSGFSYGATVTNCSITGLVQGEDTIGGLIGFAVADPLYISNCIAEINVSGSGNLGGIVGELNAQNSLIDNCSVTGSIEGTGGRIGGITGSHYSGCLIRNCTASEVIIIGYSGYIGGISGEGQGGSTDGCYVSGTIRGEGTASAGGLIGFINQNGYVKNSTTSVTVTGGGNVGGLIGQNSGGTVDHCHVSGSVATSGNYATAGGLIGYSQASVSNCTASGSVAGNGGPIGGLIGGAYEGTYFQCSASGAVTNMGEGPTGGLFGQLGGSATECYATGPVTGVSFCGGFVGGCWGGSITDCYATGSVTADGGHHIGGFAGGGSQSIVNCYSTGLVTATNVPDDLIEYLGGFSGDGDVPSSCFWNTETSGQAASAGGAVGKTTAEMKTIATFAGWNIATPAAYTDEVWFIVEGEAYPRLAWEGVPPYDTSVSHYQGARGDKFGSGRYAPDGPETSNLAWTYQTGDAIKNSPVVGPNGNVVFRGASGTVYCISPDGNPVWTHASPEDDYIEGSVGIDNSGNIYFGYWALYDFPDPTSPGDYSPSGGYLCSLASDGSVRWQTDRLSNGFLASQSPVIQNGMVYIVPSSNVLAFNCVDGSLVWASGYSWQTGYGASVGKDGAIIVTPAQTNRLMSLGPFAGSLNWQAALTYPIDVMYVYSGLPTISPETGVIYIPGEHFRADGVFERYYVINAIGPDGTRLWETAEDPSSAPSKYASPAVGLMAVYSVWEDGSLRAHDLSTGEQLWSFPGSFYEGACPSPVLDGADTVYLGGADGYFYAIASDGSEKWKHYIGSEGINSATLGNDGTVYVTTREGDLYAFTSLSDPVAGFSADPVLGPAPLTVQFTDESTNEPTEWVWQFGDGATSFAQHPSHTYTEPGTYTVSLEAANSAGSDLVTEPDLITVQISDAVTFVGTPTTGGSPLTVRFTVVNGDPTWSYLWSFGDGETSTDQNPVHRYTTRADTANFTVTLTITQNGETETIERPDYIRIDTVGLDTFTATQQMNIESVVTVGAISSIIAGIIVVVFVL